MYHNNISQVIPNYYNILNALIGCRALVTSVIANELLLTRNPIIIYRNRSIVNIKASYNSNPATKQ